MANRDMFVEIEPVKHTKGQKMRTENAFALLGLKVKDRVTESHGVVTSISFDLYGCVQAVVDHGVDKDGKRLDAHWYDVHRLEVTSEKPVMDVPQFYPANAAVNKKPSGPAHKPPR